MIRSPGAVMTNVPGTTLFVRDPDNADLSKYVWVEMGPIPGKPDWHQRIYASQAYPFPTKEAALRFAQHHSELEPERSVVIAYPDGRRWDGKRWVE